MFNVVVPFLNSTNQSVRAASALSCLKLASIIGDNKRIQNRQKISFEVGKTKQERHHGGVAIELIKNDEKLIMQVIERVLLSAAADTSSDVRLQITKEFSLQPILMNMLLDDNLDSNYDDEGRTLKVRRTDTSAWPLGP